MTSGTSVRVVVCALALTMGAAAASAQTVDSASAPAAAPAVEVTPFISLGSGFSSRIGASIAFPVTRHFSVETEVGYRRNELAALSATVNLVYGLPRLGRVAPYVATGIGVEQYGVPTLGGFSPTPLQAPQLVVFTRRTTGIALNLGAGVKVSVTDRWGYRSDVRWLNFQDNAPEGWRLYHGATLRLGTR